MDVLTRYIIKCHVNIEKKYSGAGIDYENDVRINGIPDLLLTWRSVNVYTHQQLQNIFEKFLSRFWLYKLIKLQFINVFTETYTEKVLLSILPSRGVQIVPCCVCEIYDIRKNMESCDACSGIFCFSGTRFCGYQEKCHRCMCNSK